MFILVESRFLFGDTHFISFYFIVKGYNSFLELLGSIFFLLMLKFKSFNLIRQKHDLLFHTVSFLLFLPMLTLKTVNFTRQKHNFLLIPMYVLIITLLNFKQFLLAHSNLVFKIFHSFNILTFLEIKILDFLIHFSHRVFVVLTTFFYCTIFSLKVGYLSLQLFDPVVYFLLIFLCAGVEIK